MALSKTQNENAQKNRVYWRKREDEALAKYKKSEAEYDKEIERIYADMLDSCNAQINAFYGKYADKEGISIAEAKKRVKTADIKEFERKAAKYVRDASLDRKANGGKTNKSGYYFSEKANEEMRLYNTMMKINRLEMLKANIGIELIKGHDELDKFMGDILQGRTEEELKRQAGILGKTIRNNSQLAHAIPNGSFHNATFSDRIWQYQDLMREDLSKILSSGLIQGKNPRAIAKDLKKYWYGPDPKTKGGVVYCMERLMRTEMARVQTEAQKQSFERNGFTEYEFIANRKCCDICKEKDGKHFKVSKMMPGENAAPMHPHCRCSTAAYEDSDEYEAWLDYLDKGGTTAEWNKFKRTEKEESKTKYAYKDTVIDNQLVDSPEYRRKIDELSDNTEVNRGIWNRAKEMLKHRSGTKYEDLAFVDSVTGKSLINKSFDKENYANPSTKMKKMLKDADPYTVIGIHNHPGSTVPSLPDLRACIDRKYKFGVVVCHNGKIYKYTIDADKFNEPIAVSALDRLEKIGYDDKVKKMFNDSGIEMVVL